MSLRCQGSCCISRTESKSVAGHRICDTYMHQKAGSALLQLVLFYLSFSYSAAVCHGTTITSVSYVKSEGFFCVWCQNTFVQKCAEFITNLCIPSTGRVSGIKSRAGRKGSVYCRRLKKWSCVFL